MVVESTISEDDKGAMIDNLNSIECEPFEGEVLQGQFWLPGMCMCSMIATKQAVTSNDCQTATSAEYQTDTADEVLV